MEEPKPYDCDLRHYEMSLANREFWDDCGHDWSYMTMETKLIVLGGFVQKGGNLMDVIKRYAEDRSEMYRCRIHWVILRYIEQLMPGTSYSRPTQDRIKCLSNEELVRLLSELLQDKVRKSCRIKTTYTNSVTENIKKELVDCWIVDAEKFDDTRLSSIEREHWASHPDEPATTYWAKVKRWDRDYCLF